MSGPRSSLGPEFRGQDVVLLELVHQKGPKSGPSSKQGWLEKTERESGELEAGRNSAPHVEWDTESMLMFKTEHRGRNLKLFSPFQTDMYLQNKGNQFENFPYPKSLSSSWKSNRQKANLS